MPDLDPTTLPPELADPSDIEALNEIAQQTGRSAADMIREAIHQAVLANRAWDTPFFEGSSEAAEPDLRVSGEHGSYEVDAKHTPQPHARDVLAAIRTAHDQNSDALRNLQIAFQQQNAFVESQEALLDTLKPEFLEALSSSLPANLALRPFLTRWQHLSEQLVHQLGSVSDLAVHIFVAQPEELTEEDEQRLEALLRGDLPTSEGDAPGPEDTPA